MGTALAIAGLIGAGVTAGTSIYEDDQQEEAQEAAEQMQEQQLRINEDSARAKAAQQQIVRDNQIQSVMAQQKVIAAAHGMALSSGSFRALEEASYNNFARDTQVANMNLQITEDDLNSRMDAARSDLSSEKSADWAHGIESAGSSLFNMGSLAGKYGSKSPSSDEPDNYSWQDEDDHKLDDPKISYSDWASNYQSKFWE